MTDEPSDSEKVYMEICAAMMTAAGVTEIEIDREHVPMKPFQLWRRLDGDKMIVRLIWEENSSHRH